jgi:hypothetical protein
MLDSTAKHESFAPDSGLSVTKLNTVTFLISISCNLIAALRRDAMSLSAYQPANDSGSAARAFCERLEPAG